MALHHILAFRWMNTIHKYPELLEPASVLRAAQPEASVPLRRNRLKPTIDCFILFSSTAITQRPMYPLSCLHHPQISCTSLHDMTFQKLTVAPDS